ncbi:MAG: IS66 family transposase [Acidobacteriota bacterium]
MTTEEKAASLARDERSREEIVALLVSQEQSAARIAELEQKLQWFQRQTFGQKSERRVDVPDAAQLALGQPFAAGTVSTPPAITIPSHTRNRAKKPWEGTPDGSGLRFDPSVPMREIKVPNPDTEIYPPGTYDVIDQRVTYRLAQLPGSYVVLKFVRDVLKLKTEEKFSCPAAPPAVIEKSYADVSFLAGLLIDKFTYHLPLYRLHQRLLDCGIGLARGTLTNLVHQSGALLRPIYDAQMRSILEGSVLSIDETPIRAGRKPGKKGLQSAYFWPLYGERDEVAFHFSTSRSQAVVTKLLRDFKGTYVSDGYLVYDLYEKTTDQARRAQCWSHARREFLAAEEAEPELTKKALGFIRDIYGHEATIRDLVLDGEKKLEYRTEHTKPLVDAFFAWLEDTLRERILLPSNPFTKAAAYSLARRDAMYVFLENPAVPIDTNHLERQIRPIAVGRKNWLFCWTEIGAEYVGIVQSLLRTCRLHGVDPYTYLVDVLQRIATHPASQVHLLTPRLWKEHFAANPMRSDVGVPTQPKP